MLALLVSGGGLPSTKYAVKAGDDPTKTNAEPACRLIRLALRDYCEEKGVDVPPRSLTRVEKDIHKDAGRKGYTEARESRCPF